MQRGIALFKDFLEPRHDRRRFNMAGAGQQRDELIPAQAPDHITLAKGDAQHVGKGFQRTVTLGMPIQIVDLLEVIEVEKQQGCRPFQPCAGVQCMLRQLFETTAIGQQRQLIHARDLHSGQLLLGHFRQITQQRALFLVEVAGLGVDQAQRAHFIAIGHGQRVTGV
ncbi:hypothetical protein D3C78_1454030 [compost metagenome]